MQYITKTPIGSPIIKVDKFTKKFGRFTSNKDVSFNVNRGSIHAFIGPNGSGKTTTIKMLIGAYTLEHGDVTIDGFRPGTKSANSIIGYIPEKPAFPSHLNCYQYIYSMGLLAGLKRKEAKRRTIEIITDLGMKDFIKRKPIKFSSGMQKKILLAQALINDPDILILDEPSANLDPTGRKEFQDEIIKLRNRGKTIFISSHILSELEKIIDEVTFLFYGTVVYTGPIANIESESKGVYLKTNDNERANELLAKNNFHSLGDIRSEIFIPIKDAKDVRKINEVILKDRSLVVVALRSNDLQTVYDDLLEKASRNNLSGQSLNNRQVIANSHLSSFESKLDQPQTLDFVPDIPQDPKYRNDEIDQVIDGIVKGDNKKAPTHNSFDVLLSESTTTRPAIVIEQEGKKMSSNSVPVMNEKSSKKIKEKVFGKNKTDSKKQDMDLGIGDIDIDSATPITDEDIDALINKAVSTKPVKGVATKKVVVEKDEVDLEIERLVKNQNQISAQNPQFQSGAKLDTVLKKTTRPDLGPIPKNIANSRKDIASVSKTKHTSVSKTPPKADKKPPVKPPAKPPSSTTTKAKKTVAKKPNAKTPSPKNQKVDEQKPTSKKKISLEFNI